MLLCGSGAGLKYVSLFSSPAQALGKVVDSEILRFMELTGVRNTPSRDYSELHQSRGSVKCKSEKMLER